METTVTSTPRLYTIRDVCELLKIGRTKAYELIAAGDLHTVKIGTATRVKSDSVARIAEHGIEAKAA